MSKLITLFLVLFGFGVAHAQSSPPNSLVFSLGVASSSQDDVDYLIRNANTREGGITTSAIGSGLELQAGYGVRLDDTFELFFRFGYMTQTTKGTGSSGSFNYELDGIHLFPYLRIIPLENKYFKFFLQTGLGYGVMYGKVNEGTAEVKFKGDRLGLLGGLGAEFCFTGSHCVRVEGNYRYMPIERNLATSVSGTPVVADSFTQATPNQEVEIDGRDFQTTFSGIQGIVSYVYNF